jgi:predicted PurR-regulated permease PerM
LRDSVLELVSNIPNYYDTLVTKYDNLSEDSILKNDLIKENIIELKNIDVKQFVSINSDKIMEYVKNIINIFSGIFDVFVAIVVSVYILLQRTSILKALRRFARAIYKKETYETIDHYFTKANEVFFTFIASQLLDAFIVGILTTTAMLILKVKYAPLLGFAIGLFNLIPYIGAIVAVALGIIITLITGGFGKALAMAIVVIILQQIDANIINPKILGNSLETSPLLVLFSISIGGAYFGIIGMFLAVPIAVVIKAILTDFVDSKNKIKDEEEIIKKVL